MIQASDITVVLPAIFPDRSHIWMMDASCKRFGIEPQLYGLGETYAGWLDILFYRLWRAVDQVETSHVLVSDARDAFFLASLDAIAETYNDLGSPMMLASCYEGNLAFGGFLGRTDVLKDIFKWMLKYMPPDCGDVPDPWNLYMQALPGVVTLDVDSDVFLNVGSIDPKYELVGQSLFRLGTGVMPCHIHFNGGYSDPKIGKWPIMEPLFRALGYEETPPWEKQ